jgi:hypothetical protein
MHMSSGALTFSFLALLFLVDDWALETCQLSFEDKERAMADDSRRLEEMVAMLVSLSVAVETLPLCICICARTEGEGFWREGTSSERSVMRSALGFQALQHGKHVFLYVCASSNGDYSSPPQPVVYDLLDACLDTMVICTAPVPLVVRKDVRDWIEDVCMDAVWGIHMPKRWNAH